MLSLSSESRRSFLQSKSSSKWKKNSSSTSTSTTTSKKNENKNTTSNSNSNSNSLISSSSSASFDVEVIEPGLVVLRSIIDDRECQRLANLANEWGQQGENGFYSINPSTGKKVLNTDSESGRGRIYDAATRFPTDVIQHCNNSVNIARQHDNEMPSMDCTHLLLNMYTTSKGLIWHRDIYENDGLSDHPVVNMCVGASCLFGFKHDDSDPERTVVLKNGDVLLFGGRCRLIKHAVLEILLDDCPDWMKNNKPCRYSFTFRDSPEVIGREDEFKYFRVNDHLVGQTNFQVPKDRKSFRGLPSLKSQRLSSISISTTFDDGNKDYCCVEEQEEEDLSETQDETETDFDIYDFDEVHVDNVDVDNVDDDDDIVSVSSC